MLTLTKDASSTEIVQIHKRSNRSAKPHAIVYFTHKTEDDGNLAPAAGVLALHKDALKKHQKSNLHRKV